jgi:hypothetical protein
MRLEERLLQRVLGVGRPAQEPEAVAQHPLRVAAIELLRRDLAGDDGADSVFDGSDGGPP